MSNFFGSNCTSGADLRMGLSRWVSWQALSAALAVGGLALATPAQAQEAAAKPEATSNPSASTAEPAAQAEAAEAADEGAIADIVVVGTKRGRGEVLQDVPLAATALNEGQIRAQFTPSVSDLGNFAPNVNLKPEGNTIPSAANFYIRGTGVQGSVPSDDPAVAVVVDGMPLGSNIGVLMDTFDLEGVEIYRGPQGTLFGRNATGGAVVLRSRRPSDTFGVRTEVTFGNMESIEASASVEGPVAQNLTAKMAVFYKDRDGFARNVTLGGWQGDQNTLLLRPMIRYDNDNGFDLTLIGEYGRIKGDGPTSRTRNSNIPGSPSVTGEYETAQNFVGFSDIKWRHLIADLNVDVAGGVLTSISAFRKLDTASASDADGLSGTFFNVHAYLDQEQLTQEVRWSGRVANFVDLTAGAFYFDQEFTYREQRQIAPPFAAGLRNIGGGGTINHKAWAVFAQGNIGITDGLELVLGGRYTREKKKAEIAVIGIDCPSNPDFGGDINFAACTPGFNDSESWGSFTPKVGLNYRVNSDTLLYASWSRGFRSGGFNVRSTNPAVVPGPYQPEKVDAYEIGSKLDLLDRHLRVNTALFYNKFNDLQRTAIDNQARQTVLNAAKATIWGVEGEVTAAISKEFTLSANVGYLNASYDSFIGLPPGAIRPLDELWMVNVPEWSWGVNANYSVELGNGDTLTARASYNYIDAVAYNDTNTIIEPSRDRVDASLTYATPGGFEVSIFGKNIFKNYYNAQAYNIGVTIPSFIGTPRSYGVKLSYRL